jgi:hypothetical protein
MNLSTGKHEIKYTGFYVFKVDPVLDPDSGRYFRNRILPYHKVADPTGSGSTSMFCVNSVACKADHGVKVLRKAALTGQLPWHIRTSHSM